MKTIAIYGAGRMGQDLYWYFKKNKVLVKCFIDRRGRDDKNLVYEDIPVLDIESFANNRLQVDYIYIAISNIHIAREIEKQLLKYGLNCRIPSLMQVSVCKLRWKIKDKIIPSYQMIESFIFSYCWRIILPLLFNAMKYRTIIGTQSLMDSNDYQIMMSQLFDISIKRIRIKKKIKVWIMVFLDSVWAYDNLYQLFEDSDRFEPLVVIVNSQNRKRNESNKILLESKGYRYVMFRDTKELGEPDLVMYPTMYKQYEKNINICDRKISSLIFCIPYTFWCDIESDHLLDSKNSNVLWRFYAPTNIHKKMGYDLNLIGNMNMRYSGYPKLDDFLQIKKKPSEKKIIIYAPGLVSTSEVANFGTFHLNGEDILEIAERTSDRINWIFRPHPILGNAMIRIGKYTSKTYEDYLARWKKIKGAKVSVGGSYNELFVNSDAMITDAISFVSTYQYTGNPLLYLDKEGKLYLNEYGTQLHKVIYHSNYNDINGIKKFIENILEGKDELCSIRKSFYNENINYMNHNKMTACRYIYEDIKKNLLE